jgi:hypothetical protein
VPRNSVEDDAALNAVMSMEAWKIGEDYVSRASPEDEISDSRVNVVVVDLIL